MKLKKYKLGDLCTFVNGRAYLQPELQNYGKYKIVRVGNLSGGNNSWYYSDMELEPTKYCAKGDLLYAWACNFGPYIWKGDKTIYHYHIWKVINSEQIDKMYLYYLLKFMTNSFMGCVHGSTMLHITKENMESMEVRIHASIEEQRRIATILNKLDCKIELNRQINDNLEAMAKQLYDYWFVQFDFPNEEGKPYKSSGGAMVWNDKLKREIPQRWHCGTLLDIAEYTNGLACQKYRPTDNNKLPVIKIKEMHDGLSADTEWVKADIPDDVKVFDGDVLFSWSASLEVMLWAYGNGGLNQHIFKVTSKNGYPRSFYFYQLIHYVGVFKQIAEARKTTMGHITQDHLRQSTIALPPNIDVANKLEEKLCPIFDAIVKNNQEIMALTKQRDELLPLLMNGQASVNYHLSAFRGFTTRLQIHAFTIKSS